MDHHLPDIKRRSLVMWGRVTTICLRMSRFHATWRPMANSSKISQALSKTYQHFVKVQNQFAKRFWGFYNFRRQTFAVIKLFFAIFPYWDHVLWTAYGPAMKTTSPPTSQGSSTSFVIVPSSDKLVKLAAKANRPSNCQDSHSLQITSATIGHQHHQYHHCHYKQSIISNYRPLLSS